MGSTSGDANFYRLAHDYYLNDATIEQLTAEITEKTDTLFDPDYFRLAAEELFEDGAGFYDWKALRYFLFEYEQWLQSKAKSNAAKIHWEEFTRSKKDHVTVEHIFPQNAAKPWQTGFSHFSKQQRHSLCNSLGNLLALAQYKNSLLSNNAFGEKKKSVSGATGYFNGSFSEIEVSQNEEWTAQAILKRGLQMLDFFESRWRADLGDIELKKKILSLDWLQ